MTCKITWPIELPPELSFYERMVNYFPAWMAVDYGVEQISVEEVTYDGGVFTELTNKPITAIHSIEVVSGTGKHPVTENHTFTSGDSRTDINDPKIFNVAYVKGFISGQYSTFIKSHDYTWDDNGIIWTLGGSSPDNNTAVEIKYLSAVESTEMLDPDSYSLFNNNIYWYEPEARPETGAVLKVTYYQLICNKIITALLSAFADEYEEAVCNFVKLQNSHWIDHMEGIDLDNAGELFNTPRLSGESDSTYRARLKGVIINYIGGGTIESLKKTIKLITGKEPEIYDGQYTNTNKITKIDNFSQISLYNQSETYVRIDHSTVTEITSLTGTYLGVPTTFIKGIDYDLYSSGHVRWLSKAGINPLGKIPDNTTNITINYKAEIADFDPATIRVDIAATDLVGIDTQVIYNALDDAKAAGVRYIFNIDLCFTDTVTVTEEFFSASPDVDIGSSDSSTVTETIGFDITKTIPDDDDVLIWDVDNWDQKDWGLEIGADDMVSVMENFSITIN